MSELLAVVGKRANGARIWRIVCANCKREYDTAMNRAAILRARYCGACLPRADFARHARSVALAKGSGRRWDSESAGAAGRLGGIARRRILDDLRADLRTGDSRPLWQRVIDQRKAHPCIDTIPTQAHPRSP